MEYGLIGAKLGHSYSKIIHEAVCGYSYELHPLPTEEEAHAFMQTKAFCLLGGLGRIPRLDCRIGGIAADQVFITKLLLSCRQGIHPL